MDVFLPHYVVYARPKDYPNEYVARVLDVAPGTVEPKEICGRAESLEELRKTLPPGLSRIPRSPQDDPEIVETWI